MVNAINNAQKRFESSDIFKKIKTVSQNIFSINEKQLVAENTVSNDKKQSVIDYAQGMANGTGHYDKYGNLKNPEGMPVKDKW